MYRGDGILIFKRESAGMPPFRELKGSVAKKIMESKKSRRSCPFGR